MEKEFNRPDIKIVRFKDGIDVICRCYFDKKDYAYDINEPMMFEVTHNNQLMLQHWLPLSVMEKKFVRIKDDDILCIYEPNSKFAEYYWNVIQQLNSVVNSDIIEEQETEEIVKAMEEINSNKKILVH